MSVRASYRLEKLDSELYVDYERYILNHEKSLLFHSIKYQQLINETIGAKNETYIVRESSTGKICGALPLSSKNGSLGVVYNSSPFYGSNGGFLFDDDEAYNLLYEYYRNICQQDTTCLAMISENPLSKWLNAGAEIVDERMCQFTKLDYTNPEGLIHSFHYKTRNMVRKSQKQGIDVIEDNSAVQFLYDTHSENMSAIGGKSKPKFFFDTISKYFKTGEDYKIFVAQKDGVNISALLLFYFNGVVEYYTPVIKAEYRALQPNTLLIYHAMHEAAARGYKLWNWGGTWKSQEELYRFKSRWGAMDVNYNYYVTIKNKLVFVSTPETLQEEYAYFFTIPFNLLHGGK